MQSKMQQYWRKNVSYMVSLLAVWALVSYVFGILLVKPLNKIFIGGFPLGFWFAQQGSILTFIALIFHYAWRMNKIDEKFGVHEE